MIHPGGGAFGAPSPMLGGLMYIANGTLDLGSAGRFRNGQQVPGAESFTTLRALVRNGRLRWEPDPGKRRVYFSTRDQVFGGVEYKRGQEVPAAGFRTLDMLLRSNYLREETVDAPAPVAAHVVAEAVVQAGASNLAAPAANRAERRALKAKK